jgi:hypothetical protein
LPSKKTIERYECDHGQHESNHSQYESDHGQQERNQNLNAEVQLNEDDDPMEEEMTDDKSFLCGFLRGRRKVGLAAAQDVARPSFLRLLRPVGQSWALTSTNTYFRSKKRKEKKKN